jgi:hypothetical protein
MLKSKFLSGYYEVQHENLALQTMQVAEEKIKYNSKFKRRKK